MLKSMPGRLRPACLYLGGLAAFMTSAAAVAQVPSTGRNISPSGDLPAISRRDTPMDDSGVYRREVQACRSGASHQALETCLEESRNAQAARRRGTLELAGEDYKANALARCDPFSGEERVACEARVMGFGGSSGSVAGGGVLRWVETVVLPPSEDQVNFAPKTREPVVVVPLPRN